VWPLKRAVPYGRKGVGLISRPAKIALGIGAAVLGVVVLGAALFVWQLMSGGRVSIGFFVGQIEAAINSSLKGVQVDLGDGVVEFTKDQKVAHFRFENVEATDSVGNVIARVPKANVALSGPALMNGEFAPISIEVAGASALVVRRKDGGFQLGLQVGADSPATKQEAASPGVTKAVLEAMLNPKPEDLLSRHLTRIAIVDTKLKLFDEETKSYWTAEKASLAFERKPGGVAVTVNAPVRLQDKSTWMFTGSARYQKGAQNVTLEAAFKPVRLSLLAASGAGLKALQGFNIPVHGNAACSLAVSGQLGRCKLWLNAGTGSLKLPALKPEPIHLKTAALTVEMDFPSQRYAIEEMTWTGQTIRGKVTGDGAFAFAADGALRTLTADWTAENIFIDAPNVFDGGGLALETMKLRAAFDASREYLAIEEIHASKGDFDLTLSGEMQDHPVSTGVVLNGGFKNLTLANLKRLWPVGAASGAREWVIANAHEGFIPNARVAVNIAPGAIVGGKIPDEMMNIVVELEGVKATYLDGLPDLTNAKGTATAMGDTFKMELTGGNVGKLLFSNGSFVIPNLHQRGTVGTITGAVTGPTRELLELLDRPRLGYPTRYGIKVAESGGAANVNFTFSIPMLKDLKADDVGIDVDGEFKEVKLPINETLRLTGGVFNVKLNMKGLKAHGAVQVNTAPMGFTWTEDFTGTAPVGTRLDVTGTLNGAHRAALGLDLGRYVEGKTAVIAVFTGRGGKLHKAKVDANLTGARLVSTELGWAKPEDANAAFKADVVFRPDRLIEINNIDSAGQGFKALGRLVVGGGRIREADFKKLQLGPRNDFALVYRDDDQAGFVFDVRGKVIDAGGFLEENEESGKNERERPMSIKADVDLAYLQGDVWFTGVKYEYATDGENLTAFKADASADAANVRGELVRGADNSRKLKLQTADAGRLVRAATGFRSLIGGELSLAVDLSPMPAAGQSKAQNAYDGVLKIEKFKIVNQPFLARLLAAGSFTGLDDLMRGEGITFSKLEQVFQGRGDVITLTSGRAAGPSIGLTAQGTINRASDKIDLNGTIVPLYGLNSIFGEVPLIGDILGSRDGEGIFGVTYGVSGQVDELRVAVNPVSMLAPGFLRKIFQMGPTPQAAAPMTVPPQPEPKPDAQQKKSLVPETRTN
jgi:hypothetical protein